MMETLNELAQLRDSGFGKPWPRHGLNLLYWFAKKCVSFGNDNVMIYKCDPTKGDFGFHLFEKRNDDFGNKLRPDADHPYYVVGNLNIKKYPKAKYLPGYVSKHKSDQLNSNTDRIIVSLYDEEEFNRVYVTQHHDRSNYDPNATYRISRGLLMIIRRMSLEEFLKEMGYIQPVLPSAINNRPQTTNKASSNFTAVTISSSDPDDSDSDDSKTHPSENLHTTRGFWETLCTIL
ncbi:hypothetical protein R3I93_005612 [Phoxinus phoxinus]|uniref:Uncharacterized protein n=1 Tax=Phoxinus phoxinus TaxID=58324 RepID=A0AAN9DAP5_9TELE